VPGSLWRELPETDHQPLYIDGHLIPRGTLVGVNIYSIHHNSKYFPDPFAFNPNRWLSNKEGSTPKINSAFTPFSGGSRGCAGKAMAYMEASLVMCHILLRFDFKRASGKYGYVGGGLGQGLRHRREEFQLYDHFSSSHDGPNLVLRRRGS
jgi:cytochrome P450